MNLRKIVGWLFPSPGKWLFWLVLALLSRLAFFLLQLHMFPHSSAIHGYFGQDDTDTASYLSSIDNLVAHGTYLPDFRMPGYGLLYLPLILLFSKATACNILIIIQLILSALSVYVLALIAKQLFNSTTLFYVTFYLYAINNYSCLLDASLLTESLTTSTLIFSTYFFIKYFHSHKNKHLFISGCFMTWCIFMRPVFTPLLLFFAIIILVRGNYQWKKWVIACLCLGASFAVCDGAWLTRNYLRYNRFTPLTNTISIYTPSSGYNYGYSTAAILFCRSFHGYRWDDAMGCGWFLGPLYHNRKDTLPPFPANIYTSQFNADSLTQVKLLVLALRTNHNLPAEIQHQYSSIIIKKLNAYTESIKKEKPALYYIKTPLYSLYRVFYISPYSTFYLNRFSTRFYNLLYYIILLAGLCGIILSAKDFIKASVWSVVPGIALYTILIHGPILCMPDNRYLLPIYPFIVLCAVFFTAKTADGIRMLLHRGHEKAQ